MKKEGPIGAAAPLAIAAMAGITLQSGSKQSASVQAERAASLGRSSQTSKETKSPELKPGCQSIEDHLKDFLNTQEPIAPRECYEQGSALPKEMTTEIGPKNLKFVIATLPDPLHTHLAVTFDQFTSAIQDAAQDELYDLDSSWLPWDDGAEA